MTRGMNDGVYDHGVTYYAEDDAVGKPVRESPTHLMSTRTNLVNKRISGQIVNRVTRVSKKLATKTLLLFSRTRLQLQAGRHQLLDGQ